MSTVLPIITLPDPLLRTVSVPIERVDAELNRLIDAMFATMYDAPGIGLAGIQVGIARRLLVIDIVKDETEAPQQIAMINPEIVTVVGDAIRLHEEGCLSIPDIYAELERPNAVQVKYVDRTGKPAERLCEGLLATVVQHELDHLDGKLFIDHLSRLRRDRVIRRFMKVAQAKTS
jgi:peptide deformylase